MATESNPNDIVIKATQVRLLLDFAQSNNLEVSPDQIARFHQAKQKPDEYERLDILFNELSHLIHPVTIATLHASDDYAASLLDPLYNYDNQHVLSPRQKTKSLLTFTTIVTITLLILIITRGMYNHILDVLYITPEVLKSAPSTLLDFPFYKILILFQISLDHLVPFTYGALGACAYVLIEGNNFIWNKQFDAHLIPKDKMRIVIGALSGVIGIMLFRPLFGDQTPANALMDLGEASVAFIAGYSTDFLFERLNKIISAIVPRSQGTTQKENKASSRHSSIVEHRNVNEGKGQPNNRLVVEKQGDPMKVSSSLQGKDLSLS